MNTEQEILNTLRHWANTTDAKRLSNLMNVAANEIENKNKEIKEALAYLETLANFGGTIQQARELAQKGADKIKQEKK